MVGTAGERMLRIAARHADGWNAWYSWYGNRADGLAKLLDRVDAACVEVGRDPATLERSVAVLVQVGEGRGRPRGGKEAEPAPFRGAPDELAEGLLGLAAEGISHVQLVIDPITTRSIEQVAAVLPLLPTAEA